MSQNIDLGGNTILCEDIKVGATAPGQAGTSISSSELGFIDGVTAGTVTASKALVVDANKDLATVRNLTTSGTTTYSGTTGNNIIAITDNLADALNVKEGTSSYLKFVTTNSAESIAVGTGMTTNGIVNTGAITSTTTITADGTVAAKHALATPAAASAVPGFTMGSALVGIYWGTGDPTGSAPQGSLYIKTDAASTTTRLWINTNGTTGWTFFTANA